MALLLLNANWHNRIIWKLWKCFFKVVRSRNDFPSAAFIPQTHLTHNHIRHQDLRKDELIGLPVMPAREGLLVNITWRWRFKWGGAFSLYVDAGANAEAGTNLQNALRDKLRHIDAWDAWGAGLSVLQWPSYVIVDITLQSRRRHYHRFTDDGNRFTESKRHGRGFVASESHRQGCDLGLSNFRT